MIMRGPFPPSLRLNWREGMKGMGLMAMKEEKEVNGTEG